MKAILIVDDEFGICEALKRALEEVGYRVDVANSLTGAFAKFRNHRYDAVVTEFNVRSRIGSFSRAGNGVRLVWKLRTGRVAVPILVYTANQDNDCKAAAMFLARHHDMNELLSHLSCLTLRT